VIQAIESGAYATSDQDVAAAEAQETAPGEQP